MMLCVAAFLVYLVEDANGGDEADETATSVLLQTSTCCSFVSDLAAGGSGVPLHCAIDAFVHLVSIVSPSSVLLPAHSLTL